MGNTRAGKHPQGEAAVNRRLTANKEMIADQARRSERYGRVFRSASRFLEPAHPPHSSPPPTAILPPTLRQPRLPPALAQTAIRDECLLQLANLPVKQQVGLMVQADDDVGSSLCGATVHAGPVDLVGLVVTVAQFPYGL